MNAPAVSIIITTQGARGSLAQALRSALAQDFAAFEVIIVDDAPSETHWVRRPELAGSLSDPRVRVVSFRKNCGPGAARNAGLRVARGEWVCYLDDDNEYRPNKVSAQYTAARESGSPIVLCGLEIRASGRRRWKQVEASAFAGDALLLGVLADTNVICHRREVAPEWDEELGTVDDACFFQALVERHVPASVPNVPQPLVVYNAHGGIRANLALERIYRGHRRLLVRWSRRYSARARRILLLRMLVTFAKFRSGGWCRLWRLGIELVRLGGWREWRVVANAVGVKLPIVRRWMVT